jgi:hypothetical protein
MSLKFGEKSNTGLEFIELLMKQGLIEWPIDYEPYRSTEADTAEVLDLWFGSKKWRSSNYEFLQIGQDGMGSLFCLWNYPDLNTEFPVVFFGSEGQCAVVANSLQEFIAQLGSGYLFFDGDWLEPDQDALEQLDFVALKGKTEAFTNLANCNPNEITSIAKNIHPDLSGWIEMQIG